MATSLDQPLMRHPSSLQSRIQILESALENMGDGVVAVDERGGFLLMNAAARRIYGRDPVDGSVEEWSTLYGIYLPDRVTPVPPDRLPLVRALRGESTDQVELFFRNAAHPDGLFVASTGRPLRDENNQIRGAIAVMRDISQRKHSEAELRDTNERLSQLVAEQARRAQQSRVLGEMSSLLQATVAPDEIYAVIADSLERLFPNAHGAFFTHSASRDDLEQKAVWGRYAAFDESPVMKPVACWALRRGRLHRLEVSSARMRCGHIRSFEPHSSICVPVLGPQESIGLLHVRFDPGVSEPESSTWDELEQCAATAAEYISLSLVNLRLRIQLQQQSIRDPLTGLFNRRFLEETLAQELRRAQRMKSSLSLLMIDVDHFKLFNDRHGHAAGDAVLKEFGALLRQNIRGSDVASRYGGEEFTVLLRDARLEGGRTKADFLLERTRALRLTFHGNHVGIITASIGVAAYPGHGDTAEQLLRAADTALFEAKQGGRDRVEVAKADAHVSV